MVFTQCSIPNRDSPDIDENKSAFVRKRTERIEFVFGFGAELHYLVLRQSTAFKTVSCHLLSWLNLIFVS